MKQICKNCNKEIITDSETRFCQWCGAYILRERNSALKGRDLSSVDKEAEHYYNQGCSFFNNKKYDKAVEYLTKAISISPDADFYFNRAVAYFNMEQYGTWDNTIHDNAIKDITKAIEMNPDRYDCYFMRALIYTNKDLLKKETTSAHKSIADLTKAIELNPRFAVLYVKRALNYVMIDDFEKSWDDVRTARKIGGADPEEIEMVVKELEEQSGEKDNHIQTDTEYAYRTGTPFHYTNETPYYQKRFREFAVNNGQFVPTWNWAAFLFGVFWYFYKGMYVKAIAMIVILIFFAFIPAPFFWAYCAICGNWDYYLLKVKKRQLW